MIELTSTQKSAVHKMERMDEGSGVKLHKVTGDALVRKGVAVELRNGRYAKRGRR